jgi:hypothetical protein
MAFKALAARFWTGNKTFSGVFPCGREKSLSRGADAASLTSLFSILSLCYLLPKKRAA